MNLNFVFAKSMDLNLIFSKSIHLNFKIRKKMNGSNPIRYTLRQNIASIMKICFGFTSRRESQRILLVKSHKTKQIRQFFHC